MIHRSSFWLVLSLIYFVIVRQYSGNQKTLTNDDNMNGIQISEEKRLIRHLMNRYDAIGVIGRPVENTNDKVVVEQGMGLIQILDLDEKNQVLTINVWSRFIWSDQILKWDPRNYSDVSEVRIPSHKIWTPDIVLYNYADERMKEERDVMAVVDYQGRVLWIPPAIYKSSCKIDITNFPFDQQSCHLKFGSWTYDGFKLDIQFFENKSEVNIDDYTPSNEWSIIARPARRNVKYYPCCIEPYPDLTFYLFLERNPAFFAYLLVLPCVLLSSLTLVIFWLPPESPAKMVLGMNIFVAFFLLLLLLADSTPSASTSVPLIGYYYCLNMVLITLSTFLAVMVINIYFRGDRNNRMSPWVKTVFYFIGRCLCMTQASILEDPEKSQYLHHASSKAGRHYEERVVRTARLIGRPFIRQPGQPSHESNFNAGHLRSSSNQKRSNETVEAAFAGGAIEEMCLMLGGGQPSDDLLMSHQRAIRQREQQEKEVWLKNNKEKTVTATEVIEEDLREIRRAIRVLLSRLTDKDAGSRIAREWRVVAIILDRVFFFFYLVAIISAGVTLLRPRGPQLSIAQILDEHTPSQETRGVTDKPNMVENTY